MSAAGYPLGHRHGDPRHQAGNWHNSRDHDTPPDQQGTGRPWSGARYSTDEEDPR